MHGSRLLLSGSLLLALLPLLTVPAHAAWPHDPNVNVPLSTATGNQRKPVVVSDGAGGAIAVWEDTRSGSYHIYAQRVSATGAALWTADGVAICTATGDQYYPMLAPDGVGGAIITWQDQRTGVVDIYAQRVSADGTVLWATDGVALCAATNSQAHPVIVPDGGAPAAGGSGAIVAWHDSRTGGVDVYAQRVSAEGVVQWAADGVPVCTAASSQNYPAIAPDGVGGAIVAWQDFRSGNYDIYAQRVSAGGAAQWTTDGVALCTAASSQETPVIIGDDGSGAIVTWLDYRSGSQYDVYTQRVSASGATQWTADGVALCTAAGSQGGPAMATDGAGGAIVAWADPRSGGNDVYAQRISALGGVQWTADGVALCAAAGSQSYPTIATDGAGGAIVTWYDGRSGNYDIYAQHVSGTGVAQWTADGTVLCSVPNDQMSPTIASDGAGGAIVTWYDGRNGTNDIYAQRIARFGYLGSPEPEIAAVSDVPNDQGGQVKVSWAASYLDPYPWYVVTEYRVWRSAPASLVALARAGRIASTTAADVAVASGALLASPQGTETYYWEPVGTVPAAELATYGLVTATTGDSVSGSNPLTAFMVEARTSGTMHWFSQPDSGYSVDDLAPATPALFAGEYASGTATLSWQGNAEADFAVYRLYRGHGADFVPAPENLVSEQSEVGYLDVAGAPYYYKLCAVDVHGNASRYATLLPAGTTGVDGPTPAALALSLGSANPARGGAMLRWALPAEGTTRLVVHDVTGRVVRELASGRASAGEHTSVWDGRDGSGVLAPAGMYVARLEAQGRSLSARFVLVR